MQADSPSGSGLERIRHVRADGRALEAAHASVVSHLQALPDGCVLEIECNFDPSSSLDDLAERGAQVWVRKIARRRWVLSLQPPGDRRLIDLCDLEAPIPMERVLEAAAALEPGEALIARTPCFPRPLLAQLDQRGLDWEAAEADDESALVWVRRPG
jgi:uncharacterized protein (DUF2249 family)